MENYSNTYNLSFGAKLRTLSVIESTTGRIIGDCGIDGFKSVISAFPEQYGNKKAPGQKGFRFYAMEIGKIITEKYPEIASATDKINEIISNSPQMNKTELQKSIEPILEGLGQELDIVI